MKKKFKISNIIRRGVRGQALFWSLTVVMIICLMIIARYSTYPLFIPFFSFLEGEVPTESLPYDLAIGYVSCYIFYFIQIRIPTGIKERKALSILRNDIQELLIYATVWNLLKEKLPWSDMRNQQSTLESYSLQIDGAVRKDLFSLGKNTNTFADVDKVYNFLSKADYLESELKNNINFNNLNGYLVDCILEMDLGYWFKSYETMLTFSELSRNSETVYELSTPDQLEKRKNRSMHAIKEIQKWLDCEIRSGSIVN